MHEILLGRPLPPPPMETLPDALDRLAVRPGDWLTVHAGGAREAYTAAEVRSLALRWASALLGAGVARGDRVALFLPNGARFVGAFFGCHYAGAVPVPLAWPVTLVDLGRTALSLAPLVRSAGARALVTTPTAALGDPFGLPAITAPESVELVRALPTTVDAPAFLQYTSGSLGQPRGVVIQQRAAVASAWAMGVALGLGPADVGVSWLPLFHDMGLVGGLLCPLIHGFPVHLRTPGEFLLHPGRWLRCISEERGTISAAPDFAFALATRRVRDLDGLDLSSWRHALDGAEPVHRATLNSFSERFGPAGFRRSAFRPVYGLAENTLGVSFSGEDEPDLLLGGRAVVSCGVPLPGMEITLSGAGEVLVRGPSLMSGYFGDALATARALQDGWLHTGDLGAIAEGRLYLTGREKDLVIQNGRKFHPYDIERVAAAAVAALPNGAAAFADAAERLVVLVEVRAGGEDVERLVRGELLSVLGVRPDRVVRVAVGELPRTTSGKVRRAACVERYA